MRKLKRMGVAFIAVFALSAVVASAAQAAAAEFEWGTTSTSIERMSNALQVFNVPKTGEFKCEVVEASTPVTGSPNHAASITTAAGTLKYHQVGTTNTCPATIGTATITTHNCEYRFNAGTSTSAGHSSGTVDVVNCPSTSPIEVVVAGVCTIKISNQTGLPANYANVTSESGEEVQITPEVKNITGVKSGLCPNGNGTFTNGEYHGTVNTTAMNGAAHTGLKVIP